MIWRKAAALLLVLVIVESAGGCGWLNHDDRCTELESQALKAATARDLTMAASLYEQAANEAEQCSNLLLLPSVLQSLAGIRAEKGDYSGAETSLRRALIIYEQIQLPKKKSANGTSSKPATDSSGEGAQKEDLDIEQRQAGVLEDLAKVLEHEGLRKLDEAERYYEQSLVLSEKPLGSIKVSTRIRTEYADLLRKRGKGTAAAEIQQSVEAEDIGSFEWNDLFKRAVKLVKEGKFEEAQKKLSLCLKASENFKDQQRKAQSLKWLALIQMAAGSHDQAVKSLTQAAACQRKNVTQESLDLIDTIFSATKEMRKAGAAEAADRLTAYATDLVLGLENQRLADPNLMHLATELANVSDELRYNGHNSEAEPLSRKAVAINEMISKEHPGDLITAYFRLGEVLYNGGKFPEAEKIFNKAVELARASGQDEFVSLGALVRVAHAKLALHHTKEAIKLYEQIIKRAELKKLDNSFMADTLFHLSSAYRAENNIAAARAALKQSQEYIKRGGKYISNDLAKSVQRDLRDLGAQ